MIGKVGLPVHAYHFPYPWQLVCPERPRWMVTRKKATCFLNFLKCDGNVN
jgi:hypothetical protein